MRILVCGGRDYGGTDEERLCITQFLTDYAEDFGPPITELIHGDCHGVDRIAAQWAQDYGGIVVRSFPADWSIGKKAGPLRNQRMLDEGKPETVIAFPGGRGTADMCGRARTAGIPVIEVT